MSYTPMELAEVFIKTGELTDALDALNQQLAEYPDDAEALRLRAAVQMRAGDDYQQALADIESLEDKTADDYQQLSVIHERIGHLDSAIGAVESASALQADDRLTERLLNLLMAASRLDEAITLVREQERTWRWLQWEADLLVLQGADRMASARYGLALAQLGDFEGKIRADYMAAMKARLLLARAHCYRRLTEIDTAAEHYQAAKALLPDDPTIDFNLGLLEALRGNLSAALEQCGVALKRAGTVLGAEMRQSLHAPEYQTLAEALLKSS